MVVNHSILVIFYHYDREVKHAVTIGSENVGKFLCDLYLKLVVLFQSAYH